MKKIKFFFVLLAAGLLFSTSMWAEGNQAKIVGGEEYATLSAAFAAATTNGDVIQLLQSVTDASGLNAKANVTLDLQGYELSAATGNMINNYSGYELHITGNASSRIYTTDAAMIRAYNNSVIFDESFAGKVECNFVTGSPLSIKGGYFKNTIKFKDSGYPYKEYSFNLLSYIPAEYTVNTTSLEGYNKVEPLTEANANCVILNSNDEVVGYYILASNSTTKIEKAWSAADGNKLKMLQSTPDAIGYLSADPGTGKVLYLDLNGKTLKGNSTYLVYVSSGSLTITSSVEGGKLECSGDYAVQCNSGTTLNIDGGNYTKSIDATGATVNINNGTFTGAILKSNSTFNIFGGSFSSTIQVNSGNTLNIHGGTLDGVTLYGTLNMDGGDVDYISTQSGSTSNISGGYVGTIYNKYGITLTGGEYGFDPSGYVDGKTYKAEVVTDGVRWRVVAGSVTKPAIVSFLLKEGTNSYQLTADEDISSYAYAINAIGNKTIDLNGHKLTVKHNRLSVTGTLNLTNTAANQGAVVEPVEVLEGYFRGLGATIKVNGTLNINGDIRVYGNADAINVASGAINVDGATVEANYNGAIVIGNNVTASIKNATITSASSSVLNAPSSVWSYAIRANGTNTTITLENSAVTGVQGAVGISGANTSATIKNCDLQAHNTPGYTDCYGALYVATNAIVNVWNTKMTSDSTNYSAYIGNNDVGFDWGVINLYEGCLLKDKMYIQKTAADRPYSFPSQIPTSSVWYRIAAGTAKDQCGPLPEGYNYVASEEEGYNWEVTSGAEDAKEIADTPATDVYWDLNATWNGVDENVVPKATDLVFVPTDKNVIIRPNKGTAEAQQLTIEKGGKVTVESGAVLEIGTSGLNIADGGELIIEANAVVTVGEAGALTMNKEAIHIEASETGTGCYLVAPKGEEESAKYTKPLATVELFTTAKKGKWQRFAFPLTEGTYGGNVTNNASEIGVTVAGGGTFGTSINRWNYTADKWEAINAATPLEPFIGYALSNNSNEGGVTYTFEGKIVGNSVDNLNFATNSYNLFGNSYTAPIDIKELIKTVQKDAGAGIAGSIYLWSVANQGYVSENFSTIETGMSEYKEIAPLHTYIMLNNQSATSAILDYDSTVWEPMQTKLHPTPAAPAQNTQQGNMMRLRISSANGNADDIVLMEQDQFSAAFEDGADADKYFNNGNVGIYTQLNDKSLSILASNNIEGTNLSVKTVKDVNYTIRFTKVIGSDYALQDNLTKTVTSIVEDGSYTFTAQANSDVKNRFQIVKSRKIVTSVENLAGENNAKGIYTVMGQYIGSESMWNELPAGVYVVNGVKIVK